MSFPNGSSGIFPYLLIYLQHSLGFNIEDLLGYVTKPVLIAAPFVIIALVAVIVLVGKLIDKIGKTFFYLLQ